MSNEIAEKYGLLLKAKFVEVTDDSVRDALSEDPEVNQMYDEALEGLSVALAKYTVETDLEERDQLEKTINSYKSALINLKAISEIEAHEKTMEAIHKVIITALRIAVTTL